MARRRPDIRALLRNKLQGNARYLVAVSGGMDSMSLLDAMIRVRRLKHIEIEVAHVDHGIRSESAIDACFVEAFCRERAIPFHSLKLSAVPAGVNFEAWAREERYKYFSDVLMRQALDWIVTAHTATDSAETYLMRILSNKEANGISAVDETRRIVRPLLGASRAKIEEYVTELGVPYRHDATNDDVSYLRNRVRHVLMPFLKEHFGAGVVESVGERAVNSEEDERYLTQIAQKEAEGVLNSRWGGGEFVASLKTKMATLSPNIEWRLCEEVLRPQLGFSVGYRQAREFRRFVRSGRGDFQIAGGPRFTWDNGSIRKM